MNTAEQDEQFYRDTESVAFPKLTDSQIALLEPLGQRRKLVKGELLYVVGDRNASMSVIISGSIEAFDLRDGVETILATQGPRDVIGDVAMLDGTASLASVRGQADESEILEIPAAELRRALAELPGVGEVISQAFIMRRRRIQRDPDFTGLRILSEPDCLDGERLHDVLDKNHIPHRLLDTDSAEGQALRERFQLAARDLPTLIGNDGAPLRRPSLREVAEIAGLLCSIANDGRREILCDLVIVGAGPAGLSAAVNAASEGLHTIVVEAYAPGGQAASSSLIENFFGFPTGISGGELTNRARLQAHRFGAKFSTPSQALFLTLTGEDEYRASLRIEGARAALRAKCLLIATGAEYRRIEAEGRERFDGLGVYYAATAMEAKLCRGATIVVAGGGNSAGQAAMFLSEVAEKVLLVIRGDDLSKSMSSYLSRRIESQPNITILRRTEIRKMTGTARLEAVELETLPSGERQTIAVCAVFSMIGAQPCTNWVPPEIARDEKGFVLTGQVVADQPAWQGADRTPGVHETSQPGIFAAGDVRSGSVKRCTAAVGEGGMAVEEIHRVLKTYL